VAAERIDVRHERLMAMICSADGRRSGPRRKRGRPKKYLVGLSSLALTLLMYSLT